MDSHCINTKLIVMPALLLLKLKIPNFLVYLLD